jgi:hypothetical protein
VREAARLAVVYVVAVTLAVTVMMLPRDATPQEYPGHRPHFGDGFWSHYQEPLTWFEVEDAVRSCMGLELDELHPESLKWLSHWFHGTINANGLNALFSLPNSAYIDAPFCILMSIRRGRVA